MIEKKEIFTSRIEAMTTRSDLRANKQLIVLVQNKTYERIKVYS